MARSLAFAAVLGAAPNGLAVDLGSGGGLPALVLALLWPASEWLLIDSNGRKAGWLEDAVRGLGHLIPGGGPVPTSRADAGGAATAIGRSWSPPEGLARRRPRQSARHRSYESEVICS